MVLGGSVWDVFLGSNPGKASTHPQKWALGLPLELLVATRGRPLPKILRVARRP